MPALLRTAAVAAAAAALTVAAPVAAYAAPYPPTSSTDWNGAACAGGTFTHTLPAGTFGDSRTLTESITGTGQAVPLPGVFRAAQTSYSMTSSSSGSATVTLEFPAGSAGSYNVSITQQGGGKVSYGAITVNAPGVGGCPAAAAAGSRTDPPAAASTPLATTGTHISVGVVWWGSGAVAIGGVLVYLGMLRRQSRSR